MMLIYSLINQIHAIAIILKILCEMNIYNGYFTHRQETRPTSSKSPIHLFWSLFLIYFAYNSHF